MSSCGSPYQYSGSMYLAHTAQTRLWLPSVRRLRVLWGCRLTRRPFPNFGAATQFREYLCRQFRIVYEAAQKVVLHRDFHDLTYDALKQLLWPLWADWTQSGHYGGPECAGSSGIHGLGACKNVSVGYLALGGFPRFSACSTASFQSPSLQRFRLRTARLVWRDLFLSHRVNL